MALAAAPLFALADIHVASPARPKPLIDSKKLVDLAFCLALPALAIYLTQDGKADKARANRRTIAASARALRPSQSASQSACGHKCG